jgi:glycosyltransferase involved in cell wall biosynthesis
LRRREADSPAELCHINLARGYRGGERQTELLIRALADHVSRQRLIVRRGAPLGTRMLETPGVTVCPVRTRIGAAIAAAGAGIVHAHETHAAQAALLAHRIAGAKYVLTRRVDNMPRGSRFTRALYRRAARVVVLSDAIAGVMRNFDPALIVSRIPSAASDLSSDREWVRRFRERHAGRFVVGSIGALDHSHKGQLTLIAAAERIAQTDAQIHFVLVGSGRDEATMRRAAAHLSNVSFAGWSANVGDYLAAFDLFAYPSLHEGLGSILIDAMQFGLPIVASRVGGIPELVTDRENGWLVPASDPEALADAIRALAADAEARAAMAAANREKARAYAPAVMAQRYLALYREVVADDLSGPVKVQQ